MATWRVLTWNVLGSRRPNLTLIADVIDGYSPDAVALQEIRRHQAAALAKRLGWKVRWARKHYPLTPLIWWRAEGLAVLSRFELSHELRTTISPGVSRWTFRHRILLATTVTRRDDAMRLYNVHLSSHDADARIAQARRVAEWVASDLAPVPVVAGDLNAVDEAEVIREFGGVGLRDPGGDCTSPAVAPVQRLDYVLVPERATVTGDNTPEGGQGWHQLSDHLPTWLEFTIPN